MLTYPLINASYVPNQIILILPVRQGRHLRYGLLQTCGRPQRPCLLLMLPYFPSWKTCYRRIGDLHPINSKNIYCYYAILFLPLPFRAHTKCICHKGFSGYSSIVALSNFRVSGKDTAPQSLTAHTLDHYTI